MSGDQLDFVAGDLVGNTALVPHLFITGAPSVIGHICFHSSVQCHGRPTMVAGVARTWRLL